jgi:hypothetical protein
MTEGLLRRFIVVAALNRWTGANSSLSMEPLPTPTQTLMVQHTTWGILTLRKVSKEQSPAHSLTTFIKNDKTQTTNLKSACKKMAKG